jgi:hypothetical protein
VDVTGLPEEAIRAVESLVSLLKKDGPPAGPSSLPTQEWVRQFDAWMQEVKARAHRYPPGFVVDDSREAIYEGRGE